MNKPVFVAREVAGWDDQAIWSIPQTDIRVVFDDGEVMCHGKELIISAFLWHFYITYPKGKTRQSHLFKGNHFSSMSHADVMNRVMWDVYQDYEDLGECLDIEDMCLEVYQMTNRFYNSFCVNTGAYVKSTNMTHYLEVMGHPTIREIHEKTQPAMESVEKAKSAVASVLLDPKELTKNPIALNARTGLVRMDAILDCIGPRGSLTDMNSHIFRKAVTRGFMHGIDQIEDSLMESRSATKALAFAEAPLSDTEYFNRTLQLVTGVIGRLYKNTDCKSNYYTTWVVAPNDLKQLAGKYYVTDQGLKEIRASDKHLIGESINLRTAFNCLHLHTGGVCSTCYGALSLSIPKDTNIGHVAATNIGENISQRVLGTKHTDHISSIDTLQISEDDQRYIQLSTDTNRVRLSERLKDKRVVISVAARYMERLNDIYHADDVSQLDATTITAISSIGIAVHDNTTVEHVVVPVSIGTRLASLSPSLLKYIKDTGLISTNHRGTYEIDLSQWPMDECILVMPMQHMNTMEYMNVIKTFLSANESTGDDRKCVYKGPTIKTLNDPNIALIAFNEVVKSNMNVNVVHLEIILAALLVRNDMPGAMLTQPYHDRSFTTTHNAIASRSMSASMAFQGHLKTLFAARTYLLDNRPSHPLDPVMKRK